MGKFTTFGMQQEHKQQSDESDESEDELAMNKKKEEEEEEDLILGPDDSEIKNTTSHIKHQIGQVAVTFRRIRIPDLLSSHDDLDPDTFRVLSRLSISSVTPAHLLRAVLAMAVRDWVFYSDVLAKMFGTDSRAYRAQTWCVYIRDGPQATHNLHLATWSHLTDETSSEFQALITEQAKHLTQCALRVLISLLLPDPVLAPKPLPPFSSSSHQKQNQNPIHHNPTGINETDEQDVINRKNRKRKRDRKKKHPDPHPETLCTTAPSVDTNPTNKDSPFPTLSQNQNQPPTLDTATNTTTETDTDTADTIIKRKYTPLLTSLFAASLKLRARMPLRTLSGRFFFELYVPPRGATYDPVRMEIEPSSSSTTGTGTDTGLGKKKKVVLICPMPGVIAYRNRNRTKNRDRGKDRERKRERRRRVSNSDTDADTAINMASGNNYDEKYKEDEEENKADGNEKKVDRDRDEDEMAASFAQFIECIVRQTDDERRNEGNVISKAVVGSPVT
ncbi:hypothetical protein M432DRAFT_289241 [Thermoascus aurantiacus ATCC 26904]